MLRRSEPLGHFCVFSRREELQLHCKRQFCVKMSQKKILTYSDEIKRAHHNCCALRTFPNLSITTYTRNLKSTFKKWAENCPRSNWSSPTRDASCERVLIKFRDIGTRDEEEACNPFSSYCRTYNPVTHRTPPLPSPTINTTYNSSSCKFRQPYLLLAEVWMIYSPVNAIIKGVHFVSLSTTALSCCRLSCSEPQSAGNINWTLNNRWLAESDVFLWSTALL